MRGSVILLLVSSFCLAGCSPKQNANQRPGEAEGASAQTKAGSVDTNSDPLIKVSSLTVPEDWKAVVRERYPKYLEAAGKGGPMPEFDVHYKRLSQIETEYPTHSSVERELILADIADDETPS